jgi:hypothetical protein
MTEETKTDSEKKKEDWMNAKWRPMMGWMYMATCTADFILFPVLWSLLQAVMKIGTMTQWQPLTLQGAGLFHIAMGAVLGIAAMGRTQEKLAGANNGGATTTAPGSSSSFAAPSVPLPNFGTAPAGAWNSTNSGPVNPAPSWGTTPVASSAEVTTGFGGKPAPVIPPFPER